MRAVRGGELLPGCGPHGRLHLLGRGVDLCRGGGVRPLRAGHLCGCERHGLGQRHGLLPALPRRHLLRRDGPFLCDALRSGPLLARPRRPVHRLRRRHLPGRDWEHLVRRVQPGLVPRRPRRRFLRAVQPRVFLQPHGPAGAPRPLPTLHLCRGGQRSLRRLPGGNLLRRRERSRDRVLLSDPGPDPAPHGPPLGAAQFSAHPAAEPSTDADPDAATERRAIYDSDISAHSHA